MIAELTAGQALAAVFAVYALGFICGLTVRYVQRIRDIA